jgi:signal-transduction protein with cAMP-binding, CBS, and nucleotidyltransferase domain
MVGIRLDSQSIQLTSASVRVVGDRSPVSDLLARGALVIGDDATLAEAAAAMEAANVSALLVGELGGIVTERDITRAIGHGVPPGETVASVATPRPLVVPGSMTVVEACAVMLNEQVRHLVVEVDGTVGVLSLRDVAAVLLQSAGPHLWLASLRVAMDAPSEIWLG